MLDTQMLKGILEGCVLFLISKKETYGYEILMELEKHGFHDLSEGTLYPVLTRLEKNGYIRCRKAKSPYGPIRKYFSISEDGEKYLKEFIMNYENIILCTNSVLGKGN